MKEIKNPHSAENGVISVYPVASRYVTALAAREKDGEVQSAGTARASRDNSWEALYRPATCPDPLRSESQRLGAARYCGKGPWWLVWRR